MECKIRDINVHYEEVGTGRPLLIVHGFTVNGRIAMSYLEPMFENRSGWRRIYPDLLGHGKTPAPEWMHGKDYILDALLEFMDTVAPGEHFAIAGISVGGYIARGVVHHRLKQIDGVMLCIPVVDVGTAHPDRPSHQVIHQDPQFAAALKPGEEMLLGMAVAQSGALLESVRTNMFAHATMTDPAIFAQLDEPFSFDPDLLPELCSAPTLIVTGRQDNIAGYKKAWSLLESYPRGTFAVLDRAGHLLCDEESVLFQALGNEWLDRVEEYAEQ